MNAPTSPLEVLLAERHIRDVIGRYARGVDRRDESIVRDCFHPRALAHYGDFDGEIEAFIPWVMDYVAAYPVTLHFMGNTIIDWPKPAATDFAIAETCALAFHESDQTASGKSWVGAIRYIDRFECRRTAAECGTAWRIAERTVVGDILRIDPNANHRRFGKDMLVGQAGKSDPIFELLSKMYGSKQMAS